MPVIYERPGQRHDNSHYHSVHDGDLEVVPGSLPAPNDDPVRRLVAARLLAYESQATCGEG